MDKIIFIGIALIIIIAAVLLYRRVTGEFVSDREKPAERTPEQPATTISITGNPDTKICPWCKAEIPADAIACMHCGRQASEGMVRATLLGQIGSSMLIIGLIILLGFACFISGGFGLF